MTCGACPTSWEGMTNEGKSVYARYRWGHLRVEINDEIVFGKQLRDDPPDSVDHYEQLHREGWNIDTVLTMMESDENLRILCEQVGEQGFSYDGILGYTDLKEATKEIIQWPESEG